jgi:hypothetical protein
LSPGKYTHPHGGDKRDDKRPTLRDTASREMPAGIGERAFCRFRPFQFTTYRSYLFVRFGEQQMKKILASLVTASIALISVQAFAQDASAPAAASAPAKAKKHHKQLKQHGKRAPVSQAASSAGTNDKGQQN